jgi:hypothetical protein
MLETGTDLLSLAVRLELLIGSICAVLIGRWAWREAKQYVHARAKMQKILRQLSVGTAQRVYGRQKPESTPPY